MEVLHPIMRVQEGRGSDILEQFHKFAKSQVGEGGIVGVEVAARSSDAEFGLRQQNHPVKSCLALWNWMTAGLLEVCNAFIVGNPWGSHQEWKNCAALNVDCSNYHQLDHVCLWTRKSESLLVDIICLTQVKMFDRTLHKSTMTCSPDHALREGYGIGFYWSMWMGGKHFTHKVWSRAELPTLCCWKPIRHDRWCCSYTPFYFAWAHLVQIN